MPHKRRNISSLIKAKSGVLDQNTKYSIWYTYLTGATLTLPGSSDNPRMRHADPMAQRPGINWPLQLPLYSKRSFYGNLP
jgi:hypothetical protein